MVLSKTFSFVHTFLGLSCVWVSLWCSEFYEDWAFMRDQECGNVLPATAAGKWNSCSPLSSVFSDFLMWVSRKANANVAGTYQLRYLCPALPESLRHLFQIGLERFDQNSLVKCKRWLVCLKRTDQRLQELNCCKWRTNKE